MPRTSFDESPGLVFRQSIHRQRNKSLPSGGFDYMEVIESSRTTRFNPSAFLNSWSRCREISFDLIHPPIAPVSSPLTNSILRYLTETDVPFSNNDVAAGEVYMNADGGTVPWTFPGQNILPGFYGPPVSPLLSVIWASSAIQDAFFYQGNAGAYNVEGSEFRQSSNSYHQMFTCRKARMMSKTDQFGFLGRAAIPYTTSPAIPGIRFPGQYYDTQGNPVIQVTIEYAGSFAKDVFHEVPQPAEFNTEIFRFMVWGETPTQWTARTGIPTV